MNDRFKFRAIIKGYYYIDTPKENKEFEPLIFIENVDVLDIGEIGISEEDLEIAIRKQYSNLEDIYIERMLENFRDNSNGIDTYITVTPETVQQSTGLKDKNGKLIYEGDIIYTPGWWWGAGFVHLNIGECGPCKGDSVMSYILAKNIDNPLKGAAHNIWNGAEVEVIGNIYENPELLEVEK